MALIVLAVIVVLAGIFYLSNYRDNRTFGQRMDEATEDLSSGNGIGDAVDNFHDRTPAEKVGAAIEDAGDKIQQKAK